MPSQEALERGRIVLVAGDACEGARAPSLLRASLGARLALASVAVGVLWLGVYWALT